MSWEASEGSGVAPLTGLISLEESSAAEKTRPDDVMEIQQCGAAERKEFAFLMPFGCCMPIFNLSVNVSSRRKSFLTMLSIFRQSLEVDYYSLLDMKDLTKANVKATA